MPSNDPNNPPPDEIPEDQRIGGEPGPSSRSRSKAPPPPAHHEDSAAQRVTSTFGRPLPVQN
jgi:hypothetical protein